MSRRQRLGWPACFLLAGLAFEFSLDWVDPAQTDPWLELPLVALACLGAGWLALRLWRNGRWNHLLTARRWRFAPAGALLLWAALTLAWAVEYLIEYVLGFGIYDTFRMLLVMPLLLGFYWPLILLFGSLAGLACAWLAQEKP